METNVGIWLDQREAFIVIIDDKEEVIRIESNVEERNVNGGYGSSKKYLPQDAVSESKITERKKQQLHTYFEQVLKHVPSNSGMYIFGPASTKNLFANEVRNVIEFKDSIAAIETADSMTINQIRAKVHKFFTMKV